MGTQGPDHLTFDLADSSKLSLSFYGKKPGPGMKLEKLSLQFALHETGQDADVLEAYERLIHDAMIGDHTLFNTAEGIERLWEVSTPLLEDPPPVQPYPQGSWGPPAINDLIAPRTWRLPFERRWRGNPATLSHGRQGRGWSTGDVPVLARFGHRRRTQQVDDVERRLGRSAPRTAGRARRAPLSRSRGPTARPAGCRNSPSGGEAPKAKQSTMRPPITMVGTTITGQQTPLRSRDLPSPTGRSSERRTTRSPRSR